MKPRPGNNALKARSAGSLNVEPPSPLLRNVCAVTAVAAALVAGHFAWKSMRAQRDDNRLATSPTATESDQAAINSAAGLLKNSQTLRR